MNVVNKNKTATHRKTTENDFQISKYQVMYTHRLSIRSMCILQLYILNSVNM